MLYLIMFMNIQYMFLYLYFTTFYIRIFITICLQSYMTTISLFLFLSPPISLYPSFILFSVPRSCTIEL